MSKTLKLNEEWFEKQVFTNANRIKRSKNLFDAEETFTETVDFNREQFVNKVKEVIQVNPNEGFVIGLTRKREFAKSLADSYELFTNPQKLQLMLALAIDLGADQLPHMIHSLPSLHKIQLIIKVFSSALGFDPKSDPQIARKMKTWLSPIPERFFLLVSSVPNGVSFLLALRGDLVDFLDFLKKSNRGTQKNKSLLSLDKVLALEYLNTIMRELFATQTGIKLKQIDLSSDVTASFILKHERVHKFTSWIDFERRISGYNRCCFGFYHLSIREKPLAFVQVALREDIPKNIESILSGNEDSCTISRPTHAIFYSVSNTNNGTRGLNLASHLLFNSMEAVKLRFPTVHTYATLSPAPGFRKWIECFFREENTLFLTQHHLNLLSSVYNIKSLKVARQFILSKLSAIPSGENVQLQTNSTTSKNIDSIICELCTRYILFEKNGVRIKDPVANFHVQNGAQVERICLLADVSPKGLKDSFGIMVNYKYCMSSIDVTSVCYKNNYTASSIHVAAQMISSSPIPILKALQSLPSSINIPLYAKVYSKGSRIINRGQLPSAVFFVSMGKVVVESASPFSLSDGDHFGDDELLLGEPCRYSCLAQEKCHLFILRKEHFELFLSKAPEFAKILKNDANSKLYSINNITSRI